MNKLKLRGSIKGNITFLIASIIIGTTIIVSTFSETTYYKLFINGKEEIVISGNSLSEKEKNVKYVPLGVIVRGMYDEYSWDSSLSIAIVKQKNGDILKFQTASRYLEINDKEIPLVSMTFLSMTVPLDYKAVVIGNELYVPLSVIKKHLKYDVTVTEEKAVTKIYIWKSSVAPTPVPAPTPTVTPTPISTPVPTLKPNAILDGKATSDLEANTDWLVENLGFQRCTSRTSMYNPVNKNIHAAVISVWEDTSVEGGTILVYKGWEGTKTQPQFKEVPEISKKLFKFYFPAQWEKLYNIVDGLYNRRGIEYLENTFYLDNKPVYLTTGEGTGFLYIYIGSEKK